MKTTRPILAAALAALVWSASPAGAQSFHLPATPRKGVWVEASYADLKPMAIDGVEVLETSFPTTTWFFGGRLPVDARWSVVADVPVAHARVSFAGAPEESNTVMGNPWVGVELVERGLTLEAGLRLPLTTADEESFADVVAFLADFQRGEAFMEDALPASVAASYEHGLANGMTLRGRAGIVGLFYTGDLDDVDDEALVDYGVLATYPVERARFGLGFYGRWWATDLYEDAGFSDNSVHHAALSADYGFRRVRPGVSVRLPVDGQYDEVLGSTVGLYLQVPLR